MSVAISGARAYGRPVVCTGAPTVEASEGMAVASAAPGMLARTAGAVLGFLKGRRLPRECEG